MSKKETAYMLIKEKYKEQLRQEATRLKGLYSNAIKEVKARQINPPIITPRTPIEERIVYISHPYGGNPNNLAEVERLIEELPKKGIFAYSVFSPLHNFSFAKYNNPEKIEYWEDMVKCLKFLDMKTCLTLCGNWQESLGCCIEVLYAIENEIEIVQIK